VHPLADLADQRVFGRQPGVWSEDDVELAPRAPGRLGRGLRHRHRALRVGEVGRRLLVDVIAGSAGAVAERVAALDHEAGSDPVEVEAVVEALFGEEDERVDGLRGAFGVEGDSEVPAARLHPGEKRFAPLPGLLRGAVADVLRLRLRHQLAARGRGLAGAAVAAAAVLADQDRADDDRCDYGEAGEDDPAWVDRPPVSL